MSFLECLEAGRLLEQRASGLDPADALRLERHLQGCPSCRQTADFLQTFHALAEDVDRLDGEHSDRALASALATLEGLRREHRPARDPRLSRQVFAFASGAMVAATAVFVVYAVSLQRGALPAAAPRSLPPPPLTARAPAPAAARPVGPEMPTPATLRVVSGALEGPDTTRGPGDPLDPETRYRVVDPAQIEVGAGTLNLPAGAALRWHPATFTLSLDEGSASLNLPGPRPHPLTLETPLVRVSAWRAVLDLSMDQVEVLRGYAWVGPVDGDRSATLPPGAHWTYRALPPGSPSNLAGALSEARRLLREGAPKRAEGVLRAALTRPTDPAWAARANLLLAECALAERDTERALALFTALGTDAEPAGEVDQLALFASARLAEDAGRAPQARMLYRRYLERYARGFYRPEVVRRLAALEGEG